MTESSGRLDPLQSYPAITIPSFLWGNTQGRERKLDQILLKKALEWQGKEMKQSVFHRCQSISGFVFGIKCNAVFGSGYAGYIKLNIYSGCAVAWIVQSDGRIVSDRFNAICHHPFYTTMLFVHRTTALANQTDGAN